MSWADLFGQVRRTKPEAVSKPEADGDSVSSTRSTPIPGFTVLRIAYPNHMHPASKPMTNYDIALRLCHDMDVEWFGVDPVLEHFGVTHPRQGAGANDDAFGFEFGPSEDRAKYFTVIVRETAGGGFMLMVQDAATAYGVKIRELFDAVVANRERGNPHLSVDDDGAAP